VAASSASRSSPARHLNPPRPPCVPRDEAAIAVTLIRRSAMPSRRPSRKAATARPSAAKKRRKVRYAVVGLGYISQSAVLPAFAHATRNSELRALVSDDPVKLKTLARRYKVPLT